VPVAAELIDLVERDPGFLGALLRVGRQEVAAHRRLNRAAVAFLDDFQRFRYCPCT
jgi:hypothetical protein